MKNISLALNIVLLVAVGFLYYEQFSEHKNENPSGTEDDAISTMSTGAVISDLPKNIPIVFLNADSLYARYEFAIKAKAASEGKMVSYRKTYQTKVDAFQKEYSDYMEKAGAGAYTKEQGLAIESGLQRKRDEILAMEQNQEKIMSELENSNTDVQKKIYEYLTRFNKEHGYYCVLAYTQTGGGALGVNESLDVTSQIIAGLNAEYKSSQNK